MALIGALNRLVFIEIKCLHSTCGKFIQAENRLQLFFW